MKPLKFPTGEFEIDLIHTGNQVYCLRELCIISISDTAFINHRTCVESAAMIHSKTVCIIKSLSHMINKRGVPYMKNAFSGIIVGILLILGSAFGLFVNEGRAVKTEQSLKEGAGAVIEVSSDSVSSENEGKLVHIAGSLVVADTLKDPLLSIEAPKVIALERVVEMYQWTEVEVSKKRNTQSSGTKSSVSYDHEGIWSRHIIPSDTFKVEGFRNPPGIPIAELIKRSKKVSLGAFTLSAQLIEKVTGEKAYTVHKLPQTSPLPNKKMQLYGGGVYIGSDPANPAIGDLMIRYTVIEPHDATIVAQQKGSSFIAYQTNVKGRSLNILKSGIMSAAEVFDKEIAGNKTLTWVLRVVGFIAMLIGLSLTLKPISVLTDRVPFVGNIVDSGIFFISLLVSSATSLIIISVAWVTYRPLIGVPLLLVAGGLGFVGLKKVFVKKRT